MRLTDAEDGSRRTVTGRIGRLTEADVEIVANHKGRIAVEAVALADVVKAVVQVDFSQPSVRELELCGLDPDEIARRRSRDGKQV